MDKLKSMGTAQNRKVYARHGVSEKQFGVSWANLGKLKKAIKTNHRLAVQLWTTANHDARILATMIADPKMFDSKLLEEWARGLDNYVVADAFAGMAGKTPHRKEKAEQWAMSKQEYTGQVGWNLLSQLAMHEGEIPEAYFDDYLEHIEGQIHDKPNRVRHSMNGALINIGLRTKALEKKAVAAAKRIGKVYVDHGETSCTTPDAIDYMQRTKVHRSKQTAKAKTKTKAKAKTKTKAKRKTKAKPKTRTKAKSKAKAKSKTKAKSKPKPKSKARAKKAGSKSRTSPRKNPRGRG